MAKRNSVQGSNVASRKSVKGNTGVHENAGISEMGKGDAGPQGTKPNVPQTIRAATNRSVTANGSGGLHRGDRRDMSPTYTGNDKHSARGNNARKDVKTRKR